MNKKESLLQHTQRVCTIAQKKANLTYQDAERRQKAIDLYKTIEKDQIEISGMFGGQFFYFFGEWETGVRVDTGVYCTCPDSRQHICKHQIALCTFLYKTISNKAKAA
jgi:hypothetical protein